MGKKPDSVKTTFLLLLLLGISARMYSNIPGIDIRTSLQLKNLTAASAPYVESDYIFLTFEGTPRTRFVGVALGSDDFEMLHPMIRNKHDIFYIPLQLPEEGRLVYRFSVDGIWVTDPNSQETVVLYGSKVSAYTLTNPSIPGYNPSRKGNLTTFYLRFNSGERIAIMGNFNNWSPHTHIMKEIEKGLYYFEMTLLPGSYTYTFFAGGAVFTDPRNNRRVTDSLGSQVSSFEIR